jgi:hypothetical protein
MTTAQLIPVNRFLKLIARQIWYSVIPLALMTFFPSGVMAQDGHSHGTSQSSAQASTRRVRPNSWDSSSTYSRVRTDSNFRPSTPSTSGHGKRIPTEPS